MADIQIVACFKNEMGEDVSYATTISKIALMWHPLKMQDGPPTEDTPFKIHEIIIAGDKNVMRHSMTITT